MMKGEDDKRRRSPRLTRDGRRQQLLATAMTIVREDGADRLTLGHLALRAGVSKPVAYEHFTTRSGLLIALYRWIDTERVAAFQTAMAEGERTFAETVTDLAAVFVACAADRADEFHAVGAALAGSEEKATVYQELVDNVVSMFVAVLRPFSARTGPELKRTCVGLVGAGEALAAAAARSHFTVAQATDSLAGLIRGAGAWHDREGARLG